MHVYVEDLPEMKIAFDVLLEADFGISETDRNTDRFDEVRQWFKVFCLGDLSCGLDDFTIITVEVYTSRRKQQKPMSDALVPIIYKEQLENVARDFLTKHYPEALNGTTAICPLELARRMGLAVVEKNITSDASIFGQIFFVDCEAEHYNCEDDVLETIPVNAGTIFVDPSNFFLRNLGSIYNTIVHECVHWHLHRKAFELERLYNEEATQIECQVSGGIKKGAFRTATDWMEWQANALTPKIQMPLQAVKIKTSECIRKYFKEQQTNKIIDVMELVIDSIADFFGVSRQAAKIRLYEIGYEEAAGTYVYLDGRYVKPHTFKKGFLKANQTFSICARDAIVQSFIRPELEQALK